MAVSQRGLRDSTETRTDPARGSRSQCSNARDWATRVSMIAGARILLALGLFLLVSCSSTMMTSFTPRISAPSTFDTQLRILSTQPVILRAAEHRLAIVSRDPEALAIAVTGSSESPDSVRTVLAGDLDDVVIVAWLVSFGAMGAWTAYDPRNSETIFIPVSDIPALAASSPRDLAVYRLRDQKHLMLVRPVVVGGQAVGAVGFVLTHTYADPALEAAAAQLS